MTLIDEFQDADPMQYRTFERTYRITADPGEPQAREIDLFMIGDPKQVIYAFRGADIHTCLRARETTRGRHYTLDKNFRSAAVMMATTNCYSAFAEEHPRDALRFTHEGLENPVPFHTVDARGCAERLLIDNAETPMVAFRNLDTEADVLDSAAYHQEVAERNTNAIHRWLSPTDLGRTGFADKQGDWRALHPADTTILIRGRAEAGAIRSVLAVRRLVSVYLSDHGSMSDSQEAADLPHQLHACANPSASALLQVTLTIRSLYLDWAALERLNQDELL